MNCDNYVHPRDVQFVSQLKYKTHVAVIENFTFMTSILKLIL